MATAVRFVIGLIVIALVATAVIAALVGNWPLAIWSAVMWVGASNNNIQTNIGVKVNR